MNDLNDIIPSIEQYRDFLQAMPVSDLRKAASREHINTLPSGRRVNSGRKAELIATLVAVRKQEMAEAAEKEAAEAAEKEAADKAKKAAKPAAKSGLCEVCLTAKINPATQGRDSSMCTACYEYAGWENTHSDFGHGQANVDTTCPVCANDGLLENDGLVVFKATKFAQDAKEAGWEVATGAVEREDGAVVSIVTARRNGETLRIFWDGKACRNTGTTITGTDGKVRKVRNASAARKILAS